MSHGHKPILILMGPTASGKSALGIHIARRCGGVIINADAMQCYADLQLITARPSEADMDGVPHALYGIWPARTMGHAALWQAAAIRAIHAAHAAGQVPILLGGTGMYVKGLTEGLSPVPAISDAVKAQVRPLDAPACYAMLAERDPQMAAQLKAGDHQRSARALEVMLETGQSLLAWQARQAPAPFAREQCHFAHIDVAREQVYARINARFEQMMDGGALEEVAALKAQFSAQEIAEQRFPLLKSHGVPELMAYLDGTMSLEAAKAKAKQHTRNYAKRQMTWLRGQVKDAVMLPYADKQGAADGWLKTLNTRHPAA